MKRQIHAVRGHEIVTVPGHDVKLGRGGIREIEFFVQTQQLIFGGLRPRLRGARTLDMLPRTAGGRLGERGRGRGIVGRLFVPAPGRASPANGRRRADPASAAGGRAARALREILRLRAGRNVRARDDASSAAGRKALCAAVRGCADAGRRGGQPRLHRRRGRSGDADDAAPARLPKAGGGDGDHPRLAFRAPPRRSQRPGEGGADGADPGPASPRSRAPAIPTRRSRRSMRRSRACRRRWSCFRSCARTRPCANCSAICSAARRALRRS